MWWNRLKKTLSRHVCEYAMPPALKSGPLDQFTNTHINAIQYYTICILKCLILPCLELDWFDQIDWYLVKVLSCDYVKLYFMIFFRRSTTRLYFLTKVKLFKLEYLLIPWIPFLSTVKSIPTNSGFIDTQDKCCDYGQLFFTANNNYTIDFFMKKQHYKKHCFVTTFYTYFP